MESTNPYFVPPFTKYPLSDVLSYSQLSSTHIAYTLAISTEKEPSDYKEAALIPEWKQAMEE